MKTTLRKKLTFLFVLAMVFTLITGLSVNAYAAEETHYLAFSSDVHYSTAYEQNNLDVWLKSLKDSVSSLDYMGFCGDLGSAYAASPADYWVYSGAVMDTAESYVTSGYITKGNIFTFGNHEWFPSAGGDYANNKDNEAAKKLQRIGEAAKTEQYIVYCLGAAGSNQEYPGADIEALKTYLETAPKDIPIIILTHFPLHYFHSRVTGNSEDVIGLLNNYPNVIYLWGHNHTNSDPLYDQIFKAGDSIEVSANNELTINFTYLSAGCMSDSEYGPGSAFVKGKGLVIGSDGKKVTLTYYTMGGKALDNSLTLDMSKLGTLNTEGPFTVKFKDGFDGTIIDEQTVAKGAAAKAPTPPTHDGYEFKGWNKEFSNITQNTTVTALYEVKKVKLADQFKLDKNYVYISLTTKEGPAIGKSGTPIMLYPVPWTSGMTIVDAVKKLHEMEYEGGLDGVVADNPYGFYCFTKIWGKTPEFNTLVFNSENYLDAGIEAVGGGAYYLTAYDKYANDYVKTSFLTPNNTEATPGTAISMQIMSMNMNSDYTYSALGYVADIYTGTSLSSLTDSGINSNALGNFSISFNQIGTYYVVAKDPTGANSDAVAIVKIKNAADISSLYDVRRSSLNVKVNGVEKTFEVYNIEGNTYYKLRDIAFVLNGTGSQFAVGYDGDTKTITCTTGKAYTPDGKEMIIGEDKSASAVPSSQKLIIDGVQQDLSAFNIGGNNFIKLRDLGTALKFKVDYDPETKTVLINSIEKKDPAQRGEPVGTVYFFAVIDTEVLSDTGGKKIAYYPVSIYKDDTIADAITTLHQVAYGKGDAWGYEENSKYGYVLNKLWDKETADMSYGGGLWTDFSQGKHADPAAPVTDGMIIYLNSFTGALYVRTGYFDKQYVELKPGDSLELTFNRCSGDGSVKPCTDDKVYIGDVESGTTDSNGKVTLKFDAPGTYIVTGMGKNSYSTAVCMVVVK